jgi:quinol monooxygenase YgiN
MVNEYLRYKVGADRAAAFLTAYGEAAASLRKSPHCLGYELSQCTEAPEHFVLRIQWVSTDAHLQGFRASPEFQDFFRAVKPFVNDIEEMRHYELTPLRWSRQDRSGGPASLE